MKYVLTLAAVLAASVAGSAFAGAGHVSNAQLAAMGLPEMQVMSDAQGTLIRGEGFSSASSVSTSRLPGTSNTSKASAVGYRHADAASGSVSSASLEVNVSGGRYSYRPRPSHSGFYFNLYVKVAVGSHGYASANSR